MLAAALDRAGLWELLERVRPHRIVIKPEFAGFAAGSLSVTDPFLVEQLIDLLHDRGFANVAIGGTADSSALWAGNRDIHALSDLLGYHFETPQGRPYDIVDLADDLITTAFPPTSVLHGCGVSRAWLEADMRIVFSKNRTDETEGYALCLDTLLGVLPLTDKDLHYRKRRRAGDVVADVLVAAPVDFCLVDAIVSAHGPGGRRAPAAIDTRTLIAASDIVLADYIGALKMGLDPATSPLYARTARTHPLPRSYTVSGALTPYPRWQNAPLPSLRAARLRGEAEALDRLIEPWLQRLDPELFPLKHPLDARLNAMLSEFFADTDDTTKQSLLTLANAVIGCIGQAVQSYRTMFDKDALYQHAVPLNIDVSAISEQTFNDLVQELRQIELIAVTAPQVSDELRWRTVDQAVVFSYTRSLPIDYTLFVQRVDIARTIQFMNDYVGGVLIPLARDEQDRPTRQAERNIYLPQPNYLVLYQGQPIDVSKLEVVEYDAHRHRLYWKTICSDNGSATYDDGIASFERHAQGTRITITGRQQFTLPLFWQVFDLDLVPDLKSALVTHAYRTFFDRTIANFEALVEGRDIRIGRPVDEPALRPVEQLVPLLERIGTIALPLLQRTRREGRIDADGFVHITPASGDNQPTTDPAGWAAEITRFLDQLAAAVRRDLA